jgi:hypothetical protein
VARLQRKGRVVSKIRNREEVAMPIDFNIGNGKIGGTDIDFLLEFDDKFLILVECKRVGAEIPTGQRLVLERIVDAWRRGGGKAVALHVSWSVVVDGFINLKNTFVEAVYTEDGWKKGDKTRTVKFINKIGQHWGCRKCRF